MKKKWEAIKIKGNNYYTLKEKLKSLKERLRWWNNTIFGWIDLQVENNTEELNKMETDLEKEVNQTNEEEREKVKNMYELLWSNLHYKESMLRQ